MATMSSLQVLLAGLQDVPAALTSPATTCATLKKLLAVCRADAPRQEFLFAGGLDVLADLADDVSENVEVAATLLELLAVLVSDGNQNTIARLVETSPLVLLPLDCLRIAAVKLPSKNRHYTMHIALELLAQFNITAAGGREQYQTQLLTTLLRLLENPHDDQALLLHTVEILISSLVTRQPTIQTAAGLNAVAIFLRILDTPNDAMELKCRVCAALLVVGSKREFVPVIAANNAIHSLALCLRLQHHRLEAAALKLLLLLCDESQVFGQVINEGLLPILFQIVGRQPSAETTTTICRVLEGVATFAVDCKLDLAPFMATCRGVVLVHTVTTHSFDAALVSTTFRFFATVMRNTTALPESMNSETLEGLLALYIIQGDAAVAGSSTDIGDLLATIVSMLRRSAIDTLVLEREDHSLPALYLCLRSHSTDLRFAANVFAILTRHWGSRTKAKSAQAFTGFIGIAVEILVHHCSEHGDATQPELRELYSFLHEILQSEDGGDVVLACGGLSLARALGHRAPTRPETTTTIRGDTQSLLGPSTSVLAISTATPRLQVKHLIQDVSALLSRAIAAAVDHSKINMETAIKQDSKLSSQSRSDTPRSSGPERNFFQRESELKGNSPDVLPPTSAGSQHNSDDIDIPLGDDGDGDVDDEANDDGSGSDGEMERIDEEQLNLLKRLDLSRDSIPPSISTSRATTPHSERVASSYIPNRIVATSDEPILSAPRHIDYSSATMQRVDFSKLKESSYVYTDVKGIQYPRHPSRNLASNSGTASIDEATIVQSSYKSDGLLLPHEPPLHPEPCKPPDASTMSTFIDQAVRRRDTFVAADPQIRARLVYENTTMYTDRQSGGSTREGVLLDRPTGSGASAPYVVPESSAAFSDAPGLTFDSWFESGNLERAIQIGPNEYDLVLRRDLYTTGHTQWFYFAVSNINIPATTEHGSLQSQRYRFNIINLCKPNSLFNQGLRPVLYSVRDAIEQRIGWRRGGEEIYYYPNPFQRTVVAQTPRDLVDASPDNNSNSTSQNTTESSSAGAPPHPTGKAAATYFTLTFNIDFHNTDDTYLVAHSYPFTFSDQQQHVRRLLYQHRPSRRRTPQILKHTVLCTTLQGRPCDLLTITDFSVSTQELTSRRAIILTARVHPGEAQASSIMQGMIEFLVGTSEVARVLRRLFVFQVVPMLNPDGVVHGNSRCSLSACDLNRQWLDPSPHLHPTIFHTKQLLRSERSTRGLVFFCDLHGHSRKKNVFMYGCDTKKRPNPKARMFAKLFSMQPTAKRFLSYADCSFKVSKDKETTARVVVAKEFKLSWCFTLEASFGGASFGDLQDVHFNTTHLRQVGSGLCETLLLACITDVGLRERVVSLVDDHSVSLAAMIDSHLCEAGVVSFANLSLGHTPRKESGAKPVTRKESNIQRRRTLGAIPPDEEKKTTAASATNGKTVRRVAPKRASTTLSRRRSLPPTATTQEAVESTSVTANGKTAGRGRRRQGSSPRIDAVQPAASTPQTKSKPLLKLLGTFEPPDEEDTQLYKLQSLVQAASAGASATNGTPPRACPPPEPSPSLLYRHVRAASGRNVDEHVAASSLLRFSSGDALPLPPPVSDLQLSHSPMRPSKNIRFRGAGKQYAALTPSPKAPRPDKLMKSGSMALTVGYEPELIHAATIPLQQRVSGSASGTILTEPVSLSKSSRIPTTSSSTHKLRLV